MKCPQCGSSDTRKVSVLDERWKIGAQRCNTCDHQDDWGLFMTPPLIIAPLSEEEKLTRQRWLELHGQISTLQLGVSHALRQIEERSNEREEVLRGVREVRNLNACLDDIVVRLINRLDEEPAP